MPAPVVRTHVTKCGRDTALGRDSVGAGRKHFGHARGLQAFFGHADDGAQTCTARTDDDDVIQVFCDGIGVGHSAQLPKATKRTDSAQARAPTRQAPDDNISVPSLTISPCT